MRLWRWRKSPFRSATPKSARSITPSGAGSANRRAIIVDYARFMANPPQRRRRSRPPGIDLNDSAGRPRTAACQPGGTSCQVRWRLRLRVADLHRCRSAAVQELQQLVAQRGFDVGKIDGVIGASTRQAIRAIQLKYALPADG